MTQVRVCSAAETEFTDALCWYLPKLSAASKPGTISAMSDLLEQIRQLSMPEQLLLVEKIWNGLHDDTVIVQAGQRDEGQRRLLESERDPTQTMGRDEMWKRVDDLVDE